MKNKIENRVIRGAKLAFRNFAGKTGIYNADGKREFTIILEPDVAQEMIDEGWNVKIKTFDNDGDDRVEYRLNVQVSFAYKPPALYMVDKYGKMLVDEEDLKMFDDGDLANVDLILNPYNWKYHNDTGIKAYLKKMYATLNTDELDDLYPDVDNQSPIDTHDGIPLVTNHNPDDIPFPGPYVE